MRIQKAISTLSFKSGLNKECIIEKNSIITSNLENEIAKKMTIDSKFQGFSTNAYCVKKVLEIFNFLKIKTGLNIFKVNVPSIRIYSTKDLVFPFNGYGFCIPESRKVLKNESNFITGSVFYPQENSLEELNFKIDKSYNNNERSSSHFLAPTFHEIFHEKYLDSIYKKYGYNGACSYTRKKYEKFTSNLSGCNLLKQLEHQTFNNNENDIIKNVLGNYSTQTINQYHEIFAETFTKLVCDTLSINLVPKKNPLEDLKKYPKEFLLILQKILNV